MELCDLRALREKIELYDQNTLFFGIPIEKLDS